MSIWELLIVAIVGLLVIGPEKLPDALRSGIRWFERFKRTLSDTRNEFEQQLGIDEIRQELHNEKVLESLRALEQAHKKVEDDIHSIGHTLEAEAEHIDSQLDGTAHSHTKDINNAEEDSPATNTEDKHQ